MSKWIRVKQSFERAHNDLYSDNSFTATFFNYEQGTYDPDEGEMTNQSRSKIGEFQIEIVPPSMDTTVDTDGTSLSWDTTFRFPASEQDKTFDSDSTIESGATVEYNDVTVASGITLTVNGFLVVYGSLNVKGYINSSNGTVTVLGETDFGNALDFLGEDAERPTEIEVSDAGGTDDTIYELHGYSYERGSNFLRCRVVEQ